MPIENPLLSPVARFPTDFRTIPRSRPEHYLPAFEAAFAAHRAEVDALTRVRSMPTFENTPRRARSQRQAPRRVSRPSTRSHRRMRRPKIQEIEEKLAPLMSAHQDSIQLDAALYWRIKTVHDQLDDLALEPGAALSRRTSLPARSPRPALAYSTTPAKERLTVPSTSDCRPSPPSFEKNLLNDSNDLAVVFDDAGELDGLTEGELSAAAQAAADRGLESKWVVTLTLFTGHPYLSSADEPRNPQAPSSKASRSRGARGERPTTTAPVLLEIVRLRAERAALLGYATPRGLHHPPTRRPAPPRRCTTSCDGSPCLLRAMRCRSRPRCRRSSTAAPQSVPTRGARLGVLHREGARGRVRPRPWPRCARVRGRTGDPGRRLPRRDGPLRRPASPSAATCRRTTLRPGSSRSTTRTDPRSACSSSTCTHATPSAAAGHG